MKSLCEIVDGCVSGDPKAQEKLYHQFSAMLFGVCLRYAGNYDEAMDILQDGFIKIFQSIHQVRNKEAVGGWMRRVVVNTALARFREKIKFDQIENYEDQWYTEEGELPDQIGEKELMTLIQGLPPQYKIVFNLYAIEGCTHKEISENLNISVNTSKSNLSRARNILKKQVLELYDYKMIGDEGKR